MTHDVSQSFSSMYFVLLATTHWKRLEGNAVKVGDLLKECRRRTGLGQKQFAPKLGITRQHLAKLETEATPPSFQVIEGALRLVGLRLQDCLSLPDDVARHNDNQMAMRTLHQSLNDDRRELALGLMETLVKKKPSSA